jgi:hypothetical protein
MDKLMRCFHLVSIMMLLWGPVPVICQNWIPTGETNFDFRHIKKIQAGPPDHVYALDRHQNLAMIRFDTVEEAGRTSITPVLVKSIPLGFWPGYQQEHRNFDFSSVSEDGHDIALSLISRRVKSRGEDGSPEYAPARHEIFLLDFPEQKVIFRTETAKKPVSAFHGQTLRYTDFTKGSLRLMAKDPEEPQARVLSIPSSDEKAMVIRPVHHLSIGNQGLSASEKIKICFDLSQLDFFLKADSFQIHKAGKAFFSYPLRPESDLEIFRFRKHFLLSIQPADSFFLLNPANGEVTLLPKPMIKLHQQTGFLNEALLVNFSKGCFSFFDIRNGKTSQSVQVGLKPVSQAENPRLAVSGNDRLICWQKSGSQYRFNLRSRQFVMEKSGSPDNAMLQFPRLNSKKFRLRTTRFSELEDTSNLATSAFAPGVFLNGVRIGRSGISSIDEFVKFDASEKAGFAFLHYHQPRLLALNVKAERIWQASDVDSPLQALKADEDGSSLFTISASGVVDFRNAVNGKKYASLLFDSSGREWIIWTPSGYYDASSAGEKLLSWMPASAEEQFPGTFYISSFRRHFRRPELVDAAILCRDEAEALKRLKASSGINNEAKRKNSLPAAIRLPFPGDFFTTKAPEVRLPFFLIAGRLPLKKIQLILNGKSLQDYIPDGKDLIPVPVQIGDSILELIPVSSAGEGEKITCRLRRLSGL